MPYFPPLTIDGRSVDLSHLEPFSIAFAVRNLGGRELTINVKFSNHCYTTAFDPTVHDPAYIVMDHKVERAFDPQRYFLSRQLPDLLRNLPTCSVWLTATDRNYAYLARLANEGIWYALFFRLKRREDLARRNLSMMIESAYPVGDPGRVLAGATKISFAVLCAKVFKGEAVRPRARR